MRKSDAVRLFDYSYWATDQILTATGEVDARDFVSESKLTYRSLRGTLVFALDVEQSWRRRLAGEDREVWDRSLDEEDFPSVESIRVAWGEDEAEMRAWLTSFGDEEIEAMVELGSKDRFPLSYFILHMTTHGIHQRRDCVLLLESFGVTSPEMDFLYFADSVI